MCDAGRCASKSFKLPFWNWIVILLGCCAMVTTFVFACVCCKGGDSDSKTDLGKRLNELDEQRRGY